MLPDSPALTLLKEDFEMKFLTGSLVLTLGFLSTQSHAALVPIANGDFETGVAYNLSGITDSTTGSGADWFESATGNFRDVIANSSDGAFAAQFQGTGNIHVQNGSDNYIYQSLGVLGSETAATFTFDALERAQANGDFTVDIELFASTTFTGVNGTDVEGAAGVTALGSGTFQFTSDANLATNEDVFGATIANVSLAGAGVGDTIWVKISTPRPGGDATMNIDNLSVGYVPEPGSLALLGLGGLALLRRRRA